MRKYDIPYVQNVAGSHPFPIKELEDMSLEEIVQKHIKTCGKANGNVAICSQCKSPCKQGKRAIQLLANQVYDDPPIPLYGGKTLIERAKEENMKRRQEMEKSNMSSLAKAIKEVKEAEKTEKKATRKKLDLGENWWEESLASGDQVKWIMDRTNLSKTQAKKKIYQHEWYKNKVKEENKAENTKEVRAENGPVIRIEEKPIVAQDSSLESKLEDLLRKQEEFKKEMEKYQALYKEAERKYEDIKKKTDILCSAMDILND